MMKSQDFFIDKSSFVPAYHQLARYLEKKILNKEFKPNDNIGSESFYSEKLGITRATVRRAFELLAKKGLIYSEQGKGTFVSRLDLNDVIFKVSEFFFYMNEKGLTPENQLIEAKIIDIPKKIANKLQVNNINKVLYLNFLKLANKKPIVYEVNYILNYNGLPKEDGFAQLDFAKVVEKATGKKPARGTVTITATVTRPEESKLLQVQNSSPAFNIEQVLYNKEEQPIALSLYICRGDEYRFTSTLNY